MQGMLSTAGHEIWHYIKKNYSEEFNALQEFILNRLKEDGENIDSRAAEVQANYNKYYKSINSSKRLSFDEAKEEITCKK